MVEEERRRDGKTLRASMTGTVDHELLRRNAYDELSLIQLTMPPVAIECVRNIRREALASFWEACHVAKQNVTNRGRSAQRDSQLRRSAARARGVLASESAGPRSEQREGRPLS